MWSRLWESSGSANSTSWPSSTWTTSSGRWSSSPSKDKSVDNPDLVEAFVYQAAVALQRRQVEEELRESELRLRRISEAMQDIVGQLDMEGVYRSSPFLQSGHRVQTGHDLGHYIFEFFIRTTWSRRQRSSWRREQRRAQVRSSTAPGMPTGAGSGWSPSADPIFDERGEPIGAIFSNPGHHRAQEAGKGDRGDEPGTQSLRPHRLPRPQVAPYSVKIAASTLKALAESPGTTGSQMEEWSG